MIKKKFFSLSILNSFLVSVNESKPVDTVSSGEDPLSVDETATARQTARVEQSHLPAPVAVLGELAADDLVREVDRSGERSLAAVFQVDGGQLVVIRVIIVVAVVVVVIGVDIHRQQNSQKKKVVLIHFDFV
jgi:hypothetical protein